MSKEILDTPTMEQLVYALLDRMKMPSLKETYERTGEADFALSVPALARFRINIFHQRASCGLVARKLNSKIPDPRELGVPDAVVQMCNKRRGLVLVTGATGSGKSTTLASMINIINNREAAHIITLEDPIEYLHSHNKSIVNQREIGTDTMSFAAALRAALREDPDVILVGEMRDLETISAAVTAAETGHLVFSTLHTIGAANTIDRIIDVFPPHQQQQIRTQLAEVVECVVSQQLLPRFGTTGRVAAMEVMLANSAIKNHIREGKTFQIASTIQTSRKIGMLLMDDAIYELYQRGDIDGDTALAFAQDPNSLAKKLTLY
jgi:twitching motility protein PilT